MSRHNYTATYRGLPSFFFLNLCFDVLSDGQLDGALTDLGQVGSGKALSHPGQVVEVHLLGDGGLPQVGPQDGDSAQLVRKGNVDELIKSA